MIDDKIILKEQQPQNGYASLCHIGFVKLIKRLNDIHTDYDNDENKTGDSRKALDILFELVEVNLNKAYEDAMSQLNR